MDAQTKVSRGVTQLAFKAQTCFYGSVLLSVGTQRDDDQPTMCTNGAWVKWNAEFVDRLTPDEVKGVLLHEAMHIVSKHMLRFNARDHELWNIACDYVINNIVKEMGFELPEGGMFDDRFAQMNAEKVYDILVSEAVEVPTPKWGTFEQPVGSDADKKQIEASINQKIMIAAAAARARGTLPDEVDKLIREMQRADVDLYDVLKRTIGGDQPEDLTFSRPHRKMYAEAGIISPSTQKNSTGNLIVAVDSSGSVSANELSKFLHIMNGLADDLKPESITVITCDTEVKNVTRYERGEEIGEIKIGGRGGTCCSPVFNLINRESMPVDHMIYFTDMEIWDYPTAPDYPVTWVSSWLDGRPAPFGQTTYLN